MPNYLAFTIGPIYQTMTGARYTRELWASSYLFSYLVKDITHRVVKQIPGRFVVPAVVGGLDDLFNPAVQRANNAHGAGLFPDRFIFETETPNQLPTLEAIFGETLDYLKSEMQRTTGINGPVLAYLKDYFKLYALETAIEPPRNVILEIMPYLDSLELQHNFHATDEPFLRQLFDRVTKSFLVQDAFGKAEHSFETILEVAARDFADVAAYQAIGSKRVKWQPKRQQPVSLAVAIDDDRVDELDESEPVAEETSLINYLIANHRATLSPTPAKIFRPAHKYIAVVQADGDNVGKVIEQLHADDYERFSKRLGDFALAAVGEVDAFGGMNIYAGGDDLLFFAPLLNNNETLFDLLGRLDTIFTQAFAEFPVTGAVHPTLSFGVSVTYYKFPLYEAREAAASQLFSVAKKADGKNTIALRVQKHSGQPFGGDFRISSNSFKRLTELLRFSSEDTGQTLTSVVHKIRENEFVLKHIGSDSNALQAFFDNNFNEDVHTGPAKDFLKVVTALLNDCFSEHPDNAKAAITLAYTVLRTHGFLTSTELN